MLHDASVAHSMDMHVVDRERVSARLQDANGWVLECPCVGAGARDAMDHGVPADDLLVDLESKVRERRPSRRHDRAEECAGVRAATPEVRELLAEEVIDRRELAAVPDRVEVAPHELSVVPFARMFA